MDDLGRIVIPADMREALGWDTGKKLEIVMNDDPMEPIVLREALTRCSLCREEFRDLLPVEKGYVCPQCSAKVKIGL